jgi:hypothetical protein
MAEADLKAAEEAWACPRGLRAEEEHFVRSIHPVCTSGQTQGRVPDSERVCVGSMLAEAPRHRSAVELLDLAREKDLWRELTQLCGASSEQKVNTN